jgi:hypothetical protein
MTEIGKMKGQGQPFNAGQEKLIKGQPAREKGGQASGKATIAEGALSIKAKMVEVLLTVKTEAKKGFATQSGLAQRAAGKGLDLEKLQYNGKPLVDLNPEEAQSLIAEDGYFGVTKTAERIADFVLTGAGESLERLKAGREGVQKGFQEAEQAWGGKLPEISYQTLNKALERIDARIQELGGALVDVIT